MPALGWEALRPHCPAAREALPAVSSPCPDGTTDLLEISPKTPQPSQAGSIPQDFGSIAKVLMSTPAVRLGQPMALSAVWNW